MQVDLIPLFYMYSDTTFDVDLKEGEAIEERFAAWLRWIGRHKIVEKIPGYCKEFDLIADGKVRYEVKFDRYAMKKKSPNLAFEYFYNGKPSGISTTTADFWVQYDGTYFYILEVRQFKEWIVMQKPYLRRVLSGKGAQSILIRSENLAGLSFCEMVRDE